MKSIVGRFRVISFTTGFLLILGSQFARSQEGGGIKIELTGTDYILSDTVVFGLDPAATRCIDTTLGERELPPYGSYCNLGIFDLRFIDPVYFDLDCLVLGVGLDLRPLYDSLQLDTFTVHVCYGPTSMVTLRWPSTISSYFDRSIIVFNGGGFYDTVDMETQDSVSALTDVFTIYTWGPRIVTHVDPIGERPGETYSLNQNYPNPFNAGTTITYRLDVHSDVILTVFDVLGQVVFETIHKNESPGVGVFRFDAAELSSGSYFYRITASNVTTTRKMIVQK